MFLNTVDIKPSNREMEYEKEQDSSWNRGLLPDSNCGKPGSPAEAGRGAAGGIARAWIPISDNAGVALNLLGESPRGKGGMILSSGTLMVKTHGLWEKVYLEQPPTDPYLPVR